MSQWVKNPPAMHEPQEMMVPSLVQQDPLEEENGSLLQYSCPENPMERGVLWAIVHGVAKNGTGLSGEHTNTHTHTHTHKGKC